MEIQPTVAMPPSSVGVFGVEAVERQHQDYVQKHMTRYVFAPFMDASCTQIPGGTIYTGQIVPIQAPERRALKWVLGPDEGKVLRLESPKPGEDANIAVYLDQPAPIVAWFVQVYGNEGGTEIPALAGMPVQQPFVLTDCKQYQLL